MGWVTAGMIVRTVAGAFMIAF